MQAAHSSSSDWHGIDPFEFQHVPIRGTFLDEELFTPFSEVAGSSWCELVRQKSFGWRRLEKGCGRKKRK